MSKRKHLPLIVTLMALLASVGALAAEEPSVTESFSAPLAYKKLSIDYFAQYQGPAMNHLGGGGMIDTTTLDYSEGAQNLQSQLTLDWGFTSDLFVGPVINFQINPTGGSAFHMLDSGVRIGDRHLFQATGFNWSADLRVTAPLKPANRDNHEIVDFQTLHILTYEVPKTNLTLGLLMFHALQLYSSNYVKIDPRDPSAAKDWSLYFRPYAEYRVSKSLAAVLYYEMYPYHRVGANWNSWISDPSDIAPGVSWDITSNVNLTPQILIYPGRLRWDTLGTIAYLSVSLL